MRAEFGLSATAGQRKTSLNPTFVPHLRELRADSIEGGWRIGRPSVQVRTGGALSEKINHSIEGGRIGESPFHGVEPVRRAGPSDPDTPPGPRFDARDPEIGVAVCRVGAGNIFL